MTRPKVKPGDIFFTDSNDVGPKIIKFLMASPSVWHYTLGKILLTFGKKEFVEQHLISPVRMYHAGLVTGENSIIEQQWQVEEDTLDSILNKKHIIWQKKSLRADQRQKIVELAKSRLGDYYDVPLMIGKTLGWLTGFHYISNLIQQKNQDFCVSYVAWCYQEGIGYKWNNRQYSDITTDIIDDYNMEHPEEWKIVSSKLD